MIGQFGVPLKARLLVELDQPPIPFSERDRTGRGQCLLSSSLILTYFAPRSPSSDADSP